MERGLVVRSLKEEMSYSTCLNRSRSKFICSNNGFRSKAQKVSTLEEEMMRVDLEIEGHMPVRGIPIELGGVRSFVLEPLAPEIEHIEMKGGTKKK